MSLNNDTGFQEWKTCRETLREFDKILVDLRKFGFGLITVLLSANGFLFAQTNIGEVAIMGVFAALLVLIVGLFRYDRVHEVFIRAAVLRAIDLEITRSMGLTREIAYWSYKIATGTWGQYLYVFFCFAAYLLAVAGILHSPGTAVGSVPEVHLIIGCTIAGGVAGGYVFWHHGAAQDLLNVFYETAKSYSLKTGYKPPKQPRWKLSTLWNYLFLVFLFGGTCLVSATYLSAKPEAGTQPGQSPDQSMICFD